ncbi:hypothetical protein NOR51B_2610 [Luminiphilus syltensis NOR5-1B]|uniref:GST N-terminal domain-containing protein n=1 Tax=Luminiphilus syltensis NOR5-1B TaxID=565045 RepID=B8KTX1_9GAMM|nr:glutathione S-transferase family protein [Luminiphilus syltensis]EED36658.1 hypothetical protein NOR51B_2610 [Luminiphilus syltensis NOR5-1B]
MKLIGGRHSPFVRRIAMVLEALGHDYEEEVVRTVEDGELIRRYNPVGRVPNLVLDDGRVIIDSHAILDYLERHRPESSTLFPQREDDRMAMLFADAVGIAGIEKLVLWFYEKTRRDASLRCATTIMGFETQIAEALQWLSEHCNENAYVCGDDMTLADITATSLVNTLAAVAPELLADEQSSPVQAVAARVSQRLQAAN